MTLDKEKYIWIFVGLIAMLAIGAKLTTYDVDRPTPGEFSERESSSDIDLEEGEQEEEEEESKETASEKEQEMIYKSYEVEDMLSFLIPQELEKKEEEMTEGVLAKIEEDIESINEDFYEIEGSYMAEEIDEDDVLRELDDIIERGNNVLNLLRSL